MGGKCSVAAPVPWSIEPCSSQQLSFLASLIDPEIWLCFCVPTESNLITVPHDRSIDHPSFRHPCVYAATRSVEDRRGRIRPTRVRRPACGRVNLSELSGASVHELERGSSNWRSGSAHLCHEKHRLRRLVVKNLAGISRETIAM
jgi:hypothetical protein